jgi:hypothetical protein
MQFICAEHANTEPDLAFAKGDIAQALRLYMWNTALSEALYGPLQGLEIILRNKIHQRLSAAFGTCWYDAPGFRDTSCAQATRQDRIVAELSFGSWVGLFGPKYETHLWRPHLRNVFVNSPTPFLRKQAHAALDEIRLLRNRVAHHEPILHLRLAELHWLILDSIGWFLRGNRRVGGLSRPLRRGVCVAAMTRDDSHCPRA